MDAGGVWYGGHAHSNIPEQNPSNPQQEWNDDDNEEYEDETEMIDTKDFNPNMTNMSSNDSDFMGPDTNGKFSL